MVEISATTTAPVFPDDNFGLFLQHWNRFDPKCVSYVPDGKIIGINCCIKIKGKGKKIAVGTGDHTGIAGLFGRDFYFFCVFHRGYEQSEPLCTQHIIPAL